MLQVTKTGFQMTFKNGITISVQFGPYHYCGNSISSKGGAKGIIAEGMTSCSNAEVAAWEKEGDWITRELVDANDDVVGYLTADEVLDFIIKARDFIPF